MKSSFKFQEYREKLTEFLKAFILYSLLLYTPLISQGEQVTTTVDVPGKVLVGTEYGLYLIEGKDYQTAVWTGGSVKKSLPFQMDG